MSIEMIDFPSTGYGFGITVDNVNEALPLGLDLLKRYGVSTVSRGIETIEIPGPVSTVYHTPQRRVLFDEVRDANPFFHLMESLWILSGSNRVELPKMFLNNIDQFSDDGKVFHGAYGFRLRHWGCDSQSGRLGQGRGLDQVAAVIQLLKDKPDTRQAVLSIWKPTDGLGAATKDMPCNDMVMLRLQNGRLNMTVCNRSNDVIWGAYGANVVQFSMLQEYIAGHLEADVGRYVQQSNSYHIYPTNPYWQAYIGGHNASGHVSNPYMSADVQPWGMLSGAEEAQYFDEDLALMLYAAEHGSNYEAMRTMQYQTVFFQAVVRPAVHGYELYKQGKFQEALDMLKNVAASDWMVAMVSWTYRRWLKTDRKAV